MRRENEAVVNRFLLSTLYIILGEFLLFFMYKGECSAKVLFIFNVLTTLMIISAAGVVACVVCKVLGKKNSAYYLGISVLVLLVSLFLKFSYRLDINISLYQAIVGYTTRRYGAAAIFALLFYVYEVVYYFVNVNKPNNTKR